VTRTAQGHAKALRDLSEALFLQTRELQRGALSLGQLRKAGANDPPALFACQILATSSSRRLNSIQRLASVRRPPAKHVPPPQASAIRVLQEPHAHRAARWIVQVRLAVNLEKDFLSDVLGLSFVSQDVGRHAVDQADVATKQCPQGIAVGQVHFSDEVGVRLLTADASLASMDLASHRSKLLGVTLYRLHCDVVIPTIDGSRARHSAVHNRMWRAEN
jgi:hypothetical protein